MRRAIVLAGIVALGHLTFGISASTASSSRSKIDQDSYDIADAVLARAVTTICSRELRIKARSKTEYTKALKAVARIEAKDESLAFQWQPQNVAVVKKHSCSDWKKHILYFNPNIFKHVEARP